MSKWRTRYMKCLHCGYPKEGNAKQAIHADKDWIGVYCPECGRRMTVQSSGPKPKKAVQ